MAYLIGIDPGKNTGIAVWDTASQSFVEVATVKIHEALQMVFRYDVNNGPVKVYFEDARQRQWLPRESSTSEYRGKLMGAGSVMRDSVIWQDALKDWYIAFEMVPPRKGMTKLNADTFARITGYTQRTSNHARDAAMLVFGRS